MTDLTAPNQPKEVVRQSQIIKVIQLMSEKGMSQAEACELVGINQRTYQRWVGRPEMAPVLQQVARDAIQAGMIIAVNAFPRAVERQAQIATGEAGDPRDSGKAAAFLQSLLKEAAQIGKKGADDSSAGGEEEREGGFTATFNPGFRKVTISMEPAAPIIDAASTHADEKVGLSIDRSATGTS